jgi:NAD(P)-dependent dehydrogenase (short-subunit alcohol dehydrogenase family)
MTSIKNLSSLVNRNALITGASGSLGKLFAETLAELGADLILVDKPNSNFDKLCKKLREDWNVNVESHDCDFEIQENRTQLITNLIKSKKSLNILVNNAALVGTSDLDGWAVPFEHQSIHTWRRALEVNLTAAFDLCQGLLPLLKDAEGANIINISSIYGMKGPDWTLYENTNMGNPAAYAASKSGLIGLTRWLATTISPEIRVNAIAPGGILRDQTEIFLKRYSEKTPLGRMADVEDMKGALMFLASDLARYVTGQVIVVDGGRAAL